MNTRRSDPDACSLNPKPYTLYEQGQFGLKKYGVFQSEKENVDEDILKVSSTGDPSPSSFLIMELLELELVMVSRVAK